MIARGRAAGRNPYAGVFGWCTTALYSGNSLATGWFGRDCVDFVCIFLLFNALAGVMLGGIPISVAVFVVVYLVFRRRGEPRLKRAFFGALHGIVVFEVTLLVAGFVVPWSERKGLPVPEQDVSAMLVYGALLVASILYVRAKYRSGLERQPEA
jgi:hypothetical protein